MLQFLASNAINTPTITSNIDMLYMVLRGEHLSAIGMTGELPLHDQMANLSQAP